MPRDFTIYGDSSRTLSGSVTTNYVAVLNGFMVSIPNGLSSSYIGTAQYTKIEILPNIAQQVPGPISLKNTNLPYILTTTKE
jgi:hypothetical protein